MGIYVCVHFSAADDTDDADFFKGASPVTPSVVEGSHVVYTQYYMRCLDKLDMTDTIFLKI